MRYRQMVGTIFLAISLFFTTNLVLDSEPTAFVHLSSLHPNCRLKIRPFDVWQVLPKALWLVCNSDDFLVIHPNNLIGHVEIATKDQALEYVRFFTSADSYRLFYLDGMVELMPGHREHGRDFNLVDEKVYFKYFKHNAEIKEGSSSGNGLKEFYIQRTVIYLDQRVVRISEVVRQDGFYDVISEAILYENAGKLGIYHMGVH